MLDSDELDVKAALLFKVFFLGKIVFCGAED